MPRLESRSNAATTKTNTVSEETNNCNAQKSTSVFAKLRNLLLRITKPKFHISKKTSTTNHSQLTSLRDVDAQTTAEQEIYERFLVFNNKTVEDAMIPRSDIIAVKHDITLNELYKVITKTHHTRTLVYEGSLDNIIGFVHIKDLFAALTKNKALLLKKIIRKPIITVPATKLTDLLILMKRQRTHISIVVDEYGGTDGIVTIEDIIEEIVGRIDDEHDDDKLESDSYTIIDDKTILSSGRVEVSVLEKILNVKLKGEDDEFDTIGGLVLAKVGNVPTIGTKIDIAPDVQLEVIEANARTLKQVKLMLKSKIVD